MNGKYGDLLKKARQTENEADLRHESVDSNGTKEGDVKEVKELAVKTPRDSEPVTVSEKEVSLTIKVPISWRQHSRSRV